MRINFKLFHYGTLLPLVLGTSEGILTVLTFAAGRLMKANTPVSLSLTLRISAGVFASGILMYFVSQYAELRNQLVIAERELNLTTRGKLATTYLGRQVMLEAVTSCAVASISAFFGAFIPLFVANILPQYRWIPIIVALVMLGILGIGLAKALYGNAMRWSILLIASGMILWYVEAILNIV